MGFYKSLDLGKLKIRAQVTIVNLVHALSQLCNRSNKCTGERDSVSKARSPNGLHVDRERSYLLEEWEVKKKKKKSKQQLFLEAAPGWSRSLGGRELS